jgi:hypothetical protein
MPGMMRPSLFPDQIQDQGMQGAPMGSTGPIQQDPQAAMQKIQSYAAQVVQGIPPEILPKLMSMGDEQLLQIFEQLLSQSGIPQDVAVQVAQICVETLREQAPQQPTAKPSLVDAGIVPGGA